MAQSLVLGAFNLTASDGSTRVLSEGTSRGNPVSIEVAVKTWLQDGSIVVTQGYDNREVRIRVRFFGTDLTALATTEARLIAELGKPNTLTWTPPNGPASVFDVVTSSLEADDSLDEGEGQPQPWRTYVVRLVCAGFVHSATETLTTALPATGTTTTLVNDGSATTNWTGSVSAGTLTGPTVVSGAVKVGTTAALTGLVTVSATLTTSITTSSTKYIQVDWKPEAMTSVLYLDIRAYGDGTELTKVAEGPSPTAGYTRTWFGPVAASSIAVLRLDSTSVVSAATSPQPTAIRSIYVDNINRTDVKPSNGTGRQLIRSIDVGGAVRTQGRIAIEHASSSLGDTLAYFYPDTPGILGYSPPLRQYRVGGGSVTVDSTLVSGSREDISTLGGASGPVVWDVPVNRLPSGTYLLVARVKFAGTPTAVTWSAQMRVNSTNVGPATGTTFTPSVTGGVYQIYTFAKIVLPTVDINPATSTGVVRISLGSLAATANDLLDEAWLFNIDIGNLVGPVACGTAAPASGGSANRLFIEPPTTTTPRPTIRMGFAADKSDSFHPIGALGGWQFPEFKPTRTNVLTVTTNAQDASVTLAGFNRWHTNAAN